MFTGLYPMSQQVTTKKKSYNDFNNKVIQTFIIQTEI